MAPTTGRKVRTFDAAAVAQGDDVRRENVEQALQVADFDGSLEGLKYGSGLGRRDGAPWSTRRDVRPGTVGDLTDGRGSFVDSFSDLVVLQIEYIAQHEHRPLDWHECLQHHQHRHRDAVGQRDVLGHISAVSSGSGNHGPT